MKNALPLLPRIAAVFVCATCGVTAVAAHSQDWAKAVLNKSPRHQEWVKVKYGSRTVNAFVVYPEVSHKAPVVLLIHEIFGLSDWARSHGRRHCRHGLHRHRARPALGLRARTAAAPAPFLTCSRPEAVSGLDPAIVTADLNAAADYALKLPAANGKLAVTGFCWGGGKSFLFATQRKDLSAAFVFYGPPPPTEAWQQSPRRSMASMRATTRASQRRFRPPRTRWRPRARNMNP